MPFGKPDATNVQASLSAHELLIDTILTEQDELVEAHRQQIDEIMELISSVVPITTTTTMMTTMDWRRRPTPTIVKWRVSEKKWPKS